MAIKHSSIFNLSYDNSDKLEKNGEDNTIVRKEMLRFLVGEGIIDTAMSFTIHQAKREIAHPPIIYPVKTTLIFKSTLTSDQIAEKLRKLKNNIFYVLTEVQEDENSYLGKMRDDEELQAKCLQELEEIITEINS